MFNDDEHLNNTGNTNGYPSAGSGAPGSGSPDSADGNQPNAAYGSGDNASAQSDVTGQSGTNAQSDYWQNGTSAQSADGANASGSASEQGYGGNIQYKWNYDDYQRAMAQNQAKSAAPRKHKGLKAFLISLSAVLSLAIVALACIGGYNLATGGSVSNLIGKNGTAASEATGNTNGPTLTINSAPTSSSTATKPLSGQMTVAEVAKLVRPTIVDIVTYSLSQIGETGEGSGIIMSADGYIITNNHVVSGADKVKVVLENNKEYDAKVVGSDARSDLAVLKISTAGLQYATFGNSAQLQVGDGVVAIGNPGGLEFAGTVTNGIVSALNRSVVSESGYTMNYIQTNASINPGNSGGALVNMYGQVVGINSAKISDSNYEGMGFSIPINTAKPIVDSLVRYGYVKDRVKLGITVQEFGSYEAKMYNTPTGLLVESVDTTSDAYAKGIRQGDIITKINGKTVSDFNGLSNEENKYKPGNTVTLTVYRYKTSQTMTFTVKLEEDKGTTTTTTSSAATNNYGNGNGNGYGNYSDGGNNYSNGSDSGNYYNLP